MILIALLFGIVSFCMLLIFFYNVKLAIYYAAILIRELRNRK